MKQTSIIKTKICNHQKYIKQIQTKFQENTDLEACIISGRFM